MEIGMGEEGHLDRVAKQDSDKELHELRLMLSVFILATVCLFFGVAYYWCYRGKKIKHWVPTFRTGNRNSSHLPITNKGLDEIDLPIRRRKISRQKLH
mmetsp:Transcript_8630/g.10184  ORF Transcript_8630/g.10184 Transcript_8630/m.10184 type:complete len:98 (-) Transcript_8630:1029-1322(-)